MKKLTLQQVFDTGVNGVLGQGGKSTSHFGSFCAYRGRNGFKCIIGHCIPDSRYESDMERKDAWTISNYFDAGLPETCLLDSLQSIHDRTNKTVNYDYCYIFLKKCLTFAKINNLSIENIEYELVEPTGEYKHD